MWHCFKKLHNTLFHNCTRLFSLSESTLHSYSPVPFCSFNGSSHVIKLNFPASAHPRIELYRKSHIRGRLQPQPVHPREQAHHHSLQPLPRDLRGSRHLRGRPRKDEPAEGGILRHQPVQGHLHHRQRHIRRGGSRKRVSALPGREQGVLGKAQGSHRLPRVRTERGRRGNPVPGREGHHLRHRGQRPEGQRGDDRDVQGQRGGGGRRRFHGTGGQGEAEEAEGGWRVVLGEEQHRTGRVRLGRADRFEGGRAGQDREHGRRGEDGDDRRSGQGESSVGGVVEPG